MDENTHYENNLYMRNTSFPKILTEFTEVYLKKNKMPLNFSAHSKQEGLPVYGILHFGGTRYGN